MSKRNSQNEDENNAHWLRAQNMAKGGIVPSGPNAAPKPEEKVNEKRQLKVAKGYANGGEVFSAVGNALKNGLGLNATDALASGVADAVPDTAPSAGQVASNTIGAAGIPGISDLASALSFIKGTKTTNGEPATDGSGYMPKLNSIADLDKVVPSPFSTVPAPASPQATPPATPVQVPSAAVSAPTRSPLNQAAQSLAQIPDTNPSIYQGISAEDRLAMQQQIMQRMNSGKNLFAQALGGVGDAVANSYGGKDTHFQKDIMANNQKQMENQLSAVDTARQQRMQDFQAMVQSQENDPKSPLSNSVRQTFAAAGLALPSGMSAAVAMKVSQPLAEMAYKKEMMRYQENQHQDQLFQQGKQGLMSVRGDQGLKDAESKRDASITVYNTINSIKNQRRMPSQLEYYDLLGQMWKARTGASPTDQAIKDLDSKTFKGDLGKAATYFTGAPAGATTADVLDNIQNFAKDSGLQADKFHSSYMTSHQILPPGIDPQRRKLLESESRGTSFADATNASAQQAPSQVTVVSPTGQKGTIPANRLQDYISNGYKRG